MTEPPDAESKPRRSLIMLRILIFAVAWVGVSVGLATSDELALPVRLEADGRPIDTDVGHAAPFVTDFDGDGVQDLLVGQFGSGLLWFYRNEGAPQA
jgi:hypothetical protein